MNTTTRVGLLGVALALSACASSSFEGDKIDYKSAVKGSTLEVPPDLTQLSRDSRYTTPDGVVSAAAYQAGQDAKPASPTAKTGAVSLGDVRIERDGNQRWLVVKRPTETLWDPVRTFWADSGFNLATENPDIGIMETEWAENRAKLPQDVIRQTIGKVFDSLYSTGERDKFRTRLERNANGDTEIYISHRGMVEVYSSERKDSTVWQPRPVDPELETEFLRRLMVKLGVSQEESKALASTPVQRPASARSVTLNGAPAIEMDEGFDRAWRRVGLSLDRTGFTVEDRDRSQGLYFVRYVDPGSADKKEPGFFGKLFGGSSAATPPLKYRVQVRGESAKSTVTVLNATGAPDSSPNAARIVKVLADDLK